MSDFHQVTDIDARRLAEVIGLLGADGPRTAAMLISPGASHFELCVRAEDVDLDQIVSLCECHQGPIVLISNRDAGSRLDLYDVGVFDAATEVAAACGSTLVDWLVVEGDEVTSLGWEGDLGWVVRKQVGADSSAELEADRSAV